MSVEIDLKFKHLEFVNSAISNSENRSLAIRGWAITLVVAMLALTGSDKSSVGPVIGDE